MARAKIVMPMNLMRRSLRVLEFSLSMVLLMACTRPSPAEANNFAEMINRGSGLVQRYFPKPAFDDLSASDFVPALAAYHLAEMKETPLCGRTNVDYALRVLWLASAFERDAIVRIDEANGEVSSTYKKFRAGSFPASIFPSPVDAKNGRLTEQEFLGLKDQIEKSNFYTLDNRHELTTGGKLWVVEVCDKGRYHVAYSVLGIRAEIRRIGSLVASLGKADVDLSQ